MPSGMAKEPCCLFFFLSFSEDGMGLLIGRQVHLFTLSGICMRCSTQQHISSMRSFVFSFFFFSANENVISVFSRPIGTVTPKPQCQGLKLGMAR